MSAIESVAFAKTPDQIKATQLLGSAVKYVMLFGGSRSGKTFTMVRSLILRALKADGSRHVILRLAFNHVKASIWYDTFPKVMKLCFPGVSYHENKSDWFIKFTNGSEIWFGGLDDKDRTEKILGNEYSTIYFNEVSQISYGSIQLALTRLAQKTSLVNKAYFDCNPPGKSHWSYRLFVLNKDPFSNQDVRAELYGCMLMNPDGNRTNLADDYIETILDGLSEAQKKRFKDGLWLDDNPSALWKESDIHKRRVTVCPPLKRIVIAIDPAATSKETSDETGIVVAGVGYDDRGYVLDDISGIYTPNGWALKAINSYYDFKADRIIGETNNGGDMIEAILRNLDKSVSYKGIHAKRGKVLRAEPVVAAYEQGRVSHVGTLMALETEMTTWDQSAGADSPNRVDAVVYALTELLVKPTVKREAWAG